MQWAEGEGLASVERVFSHSAALDGDAVVVFMRALCAVSQEELDPPQGGSPRCARLERWMKRSSSGRVDAVHT